LESAHVGEFLTGTMAEVKAKVPYLPKERKGLHDVIQDEFVPSVPKNSLTRLRQSPKCRLLCARIATKWNAMIVRISRVGNLNIAKQWMI
jgi:hypothetical protein